MKISKEKFKELAKEHLFVSCTENIEGEDECEVYGVNRLYQAINVMQCCTQLPTLLEKTNRVEVIDQQGRTYVNWKPNNKVKLSLQDDEKTLKVFIND